MWPEPLSNPPEKLYVCKKHGYISHGIEAKFHVPGEPDKVINVDGCQLCLGEALQILVDTFPGVEEYNEEE